MTAARRLAAILGAGASVAQRRRGEGRRLGLTPGFGPRKGLGR